MTEVAVQPAGLEVRVSVRRQVRPVALLVLFLLFDLGLWRGGVISPWGAIPSAVVLGRVLVPALVFAVRSLRWGWVLRLDAHGVTVPDHDTVPWSDFAEIAVSELRPRWSWAARLNRLTVVAFIPRPGVRVPSVLPPDRPGRAVRSHAVREQMYGTRLLLVPQAMSASVEEVLSAVGEWGHLPVTTRPPVTRIRRRTARR